MKEITKPKYLHLQCYIYNASDKRVFYLFADDTNLLFADRNLQSLETMVNMELMNVSDWLASNKLSLNVKKTNFVIFHPSQKRLKSGCS